MEFFATCGSGLEGILGDELRSLHVHGVRPLSSGVSFHGGLEDAYRALLWSRVASRVLLTLARVDAVDADGLYEGVHVLSWEDHIAVGGTFAVTARGTNDALRDTRYTGLRVKDAIVDRLRELRGERPDVDVEHPDVRVNVVVRRERATVSVDLSGTPLEQRGYRAPGKPEGAPLRENLAAAVLLAAGWPALAAQGAPLADPLCASGTLAIEAALIAADAAPGIARPHWGFERWLGHDEALWGRLLEEADARAEVPVSTSRIIAADPSERAVAYARACARRAAVAGRIDFASDLTAAGDPGLGEGGLLACSLPAPRRAMAARLPLLYARLAQTAIEHDAARVALVAPDPSVDAYMGDEPRVSIPVRNGKAESSLRIYDLASGGAHERGAKVQVRGVELSVNDAAAQQFASRLSKVAKQRRKWASRNGVLAYRVYDADLPDYNFAIDVYGGAGPDRGRTLVHVAEYAPPKVVAPAKAARRLADALRIVPEVLQVEPTDVYVKQRLRSRGGSQYAHADDEDTASSPRFVTGENGLLFEVDLGDYLDTGLFLDHRDTRALAGALTRGKSFLNLFAYTGTASVYAAAHGAKFTTTVDISNTYQQWARRNMELNGLMDEHQEFVRADAVSWVGEMRHSKMRWDFAFVDPPTFSNSSKMGNRSWDVQRDHAELLIGVSRILTRGGAALFSCNLKGFEPDVETLAKAGVRIVDITAKTIPEDFARTPKVHHAYLLKRG